MNDLASGGTVGTFSPEQLHVGDAPITTDGAVTVDAVVKYEVCVLDENGIRTFDYDEDEASECVIAAQAAAADTYVPFFTAGGFNHELLTWPEELDTFELRRAFFLGTPIHIGKLTMIDGPGIEDSPSPSAS